MLVVIHSSVDPDGSSLLVAAYLLERVYVLVFLPAGPDKVALGEVLWALHRWEPPLAYLHGILQDLVVVPCTYEKPVVVDHLLLFLLLAKKLVNQLQFYLLDLVFIEWYSVLSLFVLVADRFAEHLFQLLLL